MKKLFVLLAFSFFFDCQAIVIENKNGIVKVDKWGSSKSCRYKRDRKPLREEIVPTWMPYSS